MEKQILATIQNFLNVKKFVFFILIVFVYVVFVYQNSKMSRKIMIMRASIITDAPGSIQMKTILFWNTFYDSADFYIGFGQKPFSECRVWQCQTTNNRNALNQADAVIFHMPTLNSGDIPQLKYENQRWVFFNLESPINTPYNYESMNDLFNFTMTYRLDSDIVYRYNYTRKPLVESKNKKTKGIAWFVSNCPTQGGREEYVKNLQNYIQVDIYGNCGPFKCPRSTDCLKMLSNDYKFYLAFENSLCKDYVTEKFFNALQYNAVPVVFGGADYWRYAPSDSYINVHDFASVKLLSDYLKYLMANKTAYEQYFNWQRRNLDHFTPKQTPWCELCEKLHDISIPKSGYSDVWHWWVDQGNCTKTSTLL